MPKLEEIKKMMEAQKTPNIRIYNTNREKIFTFENDSVEGAISEMENLIPHMSSSYSKVLVEAATQAIKNRKYSGAYWWTMEFDKPTGGVLAGPENMWKVPAGYVSNDVMRLELQRINDRMDFESKLRLKDEELKKKDNTDPFAAMEKLGPLVLLAMGKTPAEIQQIGMVYKGGIAGPPAAAAQGPTLTFSDVQKLPDEEKSKKCQSLADELAKYISIEHMILLQEGLIKKLSKEPTFINIILSYI